MAEPSYRTVEENDEADPNKIATSAWARLPRGRAVRRGCPAASTCRPLARRTRGLLMLARSLKAATSEGAIATLRQGLRCGRRPRRPCSPQGHRQNHEDHRHRAPAEEAAAGRRSATGRCTLPPARQSPAAAGQDNPRWRTQFKGPLGVRVWAEVCQSCWQEWSPGHRHQRSYASTSPTPRRRGLRQ